MVKKRGFFTQLIRHLVQLAAFILFPGLFITVFSAVRDLVMAFVEGRFPVCGALFLPVSVSAWGVVDGLFQKKAV